MVDIFSAIKPIICDFSNPALINILARAAAVHQGLHDGFASEFKRIDKMPYGAFVREFSAKPIKQTSCKKYYLYRFPLLIFQKKTYTVDAFLHLETSELIPVSFQ